jgi:hypothetical protein
VRGRKRKPAPRPKGKEGARERGKRELGSFSRPAAGPRRKQGQAGLKEREGVSKEDFLFLLFLKAFQTHFQKNFNSLPPLGKTIQYKRINALA